MKASVTLYINKSDSCCECTTKSVDFTLKVCPHCKRAWTHVSSYYAGYAKAITPLRPDLIPYFPWEDWWQSQAGKDATIELRDLNLATD